MSDDETPWFRLGVDGAKKTLTERWAALAALDPHHGLEQHEKLMADIRQGIHYLDGHDYPEIEHAAWCVEHLDAAEGFSSCESGLTCWEDSEKHVTRATADGKQQVPPDYGRKDECWMEVRVTLERAVHPKFRNVANPEHLNVVRVAVGYEGWDSEPWAHMTVPEARQFAAHLQDCLQRAEEDEALLRDELLPAAGLVIT